MTGRGPWRNYDIRRNYGSSKHLAYFGIDMPPAWPNLDGKKHPMHITHAPPQAPDLTPGRDGHHRHGTVVVAERGWRLTPPHVSTSDYFDDIIIESLSAWPSPLSQQLDYDASIGDG